MDVATRTPTAESPPRKPASHHRGRKRSFAALQVGTLLDTFFSACQEGIEERYASDLLFIRHTVRGLKAHICRMEGWDEADAERACSGEDLDEDLTDLDEGVAENLTDLDEDIEEGSTDLDKNLAESLRDLDEDLEEGPVDLDEDLTTQISSIPSATSTSVPSTPIVQGVCCMSGRF